MQSLDYAIIKFINDLVSREIWLQLIVSPLGEWLIFAMVLLVLVLVWRLYRRKETVMAKKLAELLAASLLLPYLVNLVISSLWFRPRPFILPDVVLFISQPLSPKSFPSDHSAWAFALALSVFLVDKKTGSLMFVLAALVAL